MVYNPAVFCWDIPNKDGRVFFVFFCFGAGPRHRNVFFSAVPSLWVRKIEKILFHNV